jgi:hypothetical protein
MSAHTIIWPAITEADLFRGYGVTRAQLRAIVDPPDQIEEYLAQVKREEEAMRLARFLRERLGHG